MKLIFSVFQTFHQIMTQLEDKLADSTEDIAVIYDDHIDETT